MTEKVQEFLTRSNGAEGTLLIPRKIYDQLIPEVQRAQIGRQYAAHVVGPAEVPGSSVDINLATPQSMRVFKVAEGASVPISEHAYTTVNIKPDKFGVRPLITKEMIEDSQFNLMQDNLKQGMLELAYNETALIVSALDGAATTVAGGAALTIANITTAMLALENNNYKPSVLFIGPEALNDLRNIDTFVEYNKSGDNALHTGAIGNIFGMEVVKVTAGGFTTTSSYVVDASQAYAVVEKRGIESKEYEDVPADQMGVLLTQRVAVSLLRSAAVAKITTS